MAVINLSEINQYIKNLFDRINLRDLEAHHADRIRKWFVNNLSNVGRYAVRDFERFGNLTSLGKPYNDNRGSHFDRSDGWVSLTEEVPDIDHLTYGTGMLYVHGEMELPLYWPEQSKDGYGEAGDHIYDDEFHQTNYSGTQKHIFQRTKNDPPPVFWYEPEPTKDRPNKRLGPAPAWGDQGQRHGYLWHDTPDVDQDILQGTDTPIGGTTAAYSEPDCWMMETITYNIGSDIVKETNSESPDGDNDDSIYHLGNERNHFPYRIICAASPEAINDMLDRYVDEYENGMYDGKIPTIIEEVGTYPPIPGHKFVKGGKKAIIDFLSPINEVPAGGNGKNSVEYARAFFYRTGIDVTDPSTFPPNEIPPEDRAARGFNPNNVPYGPDA